eukprot:gb/GFBE01070723.1/.p1 GENE.gb/GFBE01070723.1/~~gb/GFBE01070723.1/.p1  ORF type:complete len:382 (+),score=71.82 gb/GFBE01070723.1/:1-1146(+)
MPDVVLEGWLLKRGPTIDYSWQRRWCVLTSSGIAYFADSAKRHKKGEVEIGPCSETTRIASFEAPGDSIKHRLERPWGFAVDAVPPAGKQRRIHYFDAGDAGSLATWLNAIRDVMKVISFQEGDIVMVKEAFRSDSQVKEMLKERMIGTIHTVDEDDDISVEFDGLEGRQWVFSKNKHKLRILPDDAEKQLDLEIVPLNDVIMHWALRVTSRELSRCYEFEAQGVCIGKSSALDRGLPLRTRRLSGSTCKSHREITAFAKEFAAENKYDAAGNNTFGGKNCQDFVLELCRHLRIDTEQLPMRQAEKVKTLLGAGAIVAADVALGTGLLAGAVEAGGMAAGAAAGVAAGALSAPVMLTGAAVLGVAVSMGLQTEIADERRFR